MRPIQWYLKNNWRVPRKGHTSAKVVPPSSKLVAGGKQCVLRSTITPNKHALQIITDASKEEWGT